jgi:aminotransferase EvaB
MGQVPMNDLRAAWRNSPQSKAVASEVLDSGWFVHGPNHAAFEVQLADHVGVNHAVGVASGTDALMLALAAVGCGPGKTVATVANAGAYTSVAAVAIGCSITFVDVDPDALLISPESLKEELGRQRIDAVVLTHLYGNSVSSEAFRICRNAGVPVVEDCAQAVGAKTADGYCGSLGDIATFSFYPTKNLGAAGDGGAITTDDENLADTARSLRQYGWEQKYRIGAAGGRNSRLDELQAALLCVGLKELPRWNARRRSIVQSYSAAVENNQDLRLITGCNESSSAHLAVVQTAVGERDNLRAYLSDQGIASDVHYPVPDHQQPGLQSSIDPKSPTELPHSEIACESVVSVPCFPEMSEEQVERVATALRDWQPT